MKFVLVMLSQSAPCALLDMEGFMQGLSLRDTWDRNHIVCNAHKIASTYPFRPNMSLEYIAT